MRFGAPPLVAARANAWGVAPTMRKSSWPLRGGGCLVLLMVNPLGCQLVGAVFPAAKPL